MSTKTPKIAVIHDAFLYRGGGERLVALMAQALGADLITGFLSEGSFDPRELGFTGRIISLGSPVFPKGIRHMILKWRFFWSARMLRDYDTVIFSGDCLGALRHVRSDARALYYCHTPPRYLYDFRDRYISHLSWFLRPVFSLAFRFFAGVYERHLDRFDLILANSKNVQKRLRDFTGYESEIIYPPTDMARFAPLGDMSDGDLSRIHPGIHASRYFLSFARLSPPKRVESIIDAFLEMPDQCLVFCYGKNDPLRELILQKIEGKDNIIALQSPNDADLISLIQGAQATIYVPMDEDFGMSPVESMACGTPVIGVAEGGLLETIIDGQTGFLIKNDQISNHIRSIIQEIPYETWRGMRDRCIIQAENFSLEKFTKKLQGLVDFPN